jgi:putative protease
MEVELGKVMHYYDHVRVAVLLLNGELKLGDQIHIHGHTTDFTQRVGSMEIDHESVLWAKPGNTVAIKVIELVHEHDKVYRVIEAALEPHPA